MYRYDGRVFALCLSLALGFSFSAVSAQAQDIYPIEIQSVDLNNADTFATVKLRAEAALEWQEEAGATDLALVLARSVPGPEALDVASSSGLVSLVEVGFAVPDGVPTTRLTISVREEFSYRVESSAAGLTVRLIRDGGALEVQGAADEPSSPTTGADLEALVRENETLKRRAAELHRDRLELRQSLQAAQNSLAAQLEAAASNRAAELEALQAEVTQLQGELAAERQRDRERVSASAALQEEANRLSAELDQARTAEQEATRQLSAAQGAADEMTRHLTTARSAAQDAEARLAELTQSRDELAREVGTLEAALGDLRAGSAQVDEIREDNNQLRSWLASAPEVLGAHSFAVRAGGECLPMHPEPDGTSAVLSCLPAGAELSALNLRPEWLRVRTADNREGWVSVAGVEPHATGPSAGEYQQSVEQADALRSRVEQLEQQIQNTAARASTTDQEASALSVQLENERSERQAAEGRLAELAAELEDSRGQIANRSADLDAARSDLEREVKRSQGLESRIRALESGEVMTASIVARSVQPCLTIRSGPGTQHDRLDCAPPGTALSILDTAEDWYSIEAVGFGTGWVASRFVETTEITTAERQGAELAQARSEASALASEVTELKRQLASIQEESSQTETRLAQVSAELESARQEAQGQSSELASERDRLARRAEQASANQMKLQTQLRELELTLEDERAQFLSFLESGRVVVSAEAEPCLSLRPEPRAAGRAIDCLKPGTEASPMSFSAGWLRLKLDDGREGWSSGDFLDSAEQSRLQRTEAQLAEVVAQLAASNSQRESLAERVQDLEATGQDSERASSTLLEQVGQLQAQLSESEQTEARLRDELLTAQNASSGEHERLANELEGARGEARSLSTRLAESEQSEALLRQELASLQSATSDEEQSLVAELEAARAELEDLSSRLAASEQGREELGQQLSTARDAGSQEQQQLATDLARTRTELDELQSRLAEVESARAAERQVAENARASMAAELASIANERDSLKRAADEEADNELQMYSASLEQLERQNSDLVNRLEVLERDKTELIEAHAEAIAAATAGNASQLTELEARVLDLESRNRAMAADSAALADARESLAAAQAYSEELSRRLAQLELDAQAPSTIAEVQEAVEPAVEPEWVEAPLAEAEEPLGVDQSVEEPLMPAEPAPEAVVAESAPEPEQLSEPELAQELEPEAQPVVAADLEAVARAWGRAWAAQRVDDYLSFYAADFVPSNGMARAAWEDQRRDRLTRPEFIEVAITDLTTRIDGPDRATVVFQQAYKSNTFEDRVEKTLVLVREGDLWKIAEETSQ